MKIAPEKKNRTYLAIGLMVVAFAAVWYFDFSGPDTSGPAVSVGASPGASAVATAAPGAPGGKPGAVSSALPLDPTLHLDKLAALRAMEYSGTGRDLFHFGAAPAKVAANGPGGRGPLGAAPVAPGNPAAMAPARPAGPPPPPPIPLKFTGYADPDQGADKVFLHMGDNDYVVAEGDTIEHRYLIVKINKLSVRVKDLQTQSEQELPLQQG